MRRSIIIYSFFLWLIANNSLANALINLKNRLDKMDNFCANFTQKVTDSSGNILQEGDGSLWIKRPSFFNCHMIQPYENILISDGETLWFYNPLVKQVTITWLKDKINNTPFTLIIKNQISDWQQYNIFQENDHFTLIPKNFRINLKKLMLNLSQDGLIHKLSFIDLDNHNITYQFKLQKISTINKSKFIFTPPYDVTIDDQRNK